VSPRLGEAQDFGVKPEGTIQIIDPVTGMQKFIYNGHSSRMPILSGRSKT